MKLKKLLKDIPCKAIKGSKEIEITGICGDSRSVAPGNLFIARRGSSFNGADFIGDAVLAGAIVVFTDMYDPFLEVVQVILDDVEKVIPDVASNYYENPSKKLFTVGITGTNGKTTTSYLVKHILDGVGEFSGLLGTVEYIFGKNRIFAALTTPDSVLTQKYLKEMVLNELKSAVMEVSSHGIYQDRVKNIDFDVGIFTNLTSDHLDYHKSFENYKNTKSKFFKVLKEDAFAIINGDDVFAEDMVREAKSKVLTYGISKKCDVMASDIKVSLFGLEFDVSYKGEKEKFISYITGKFNVYNILAAISVGIVKGIKLKKIKELIKSFKCVKGRLEKVFFKDFHVFVDFAHTKDALKNVLTTLNEMKREKIITVFGCGGNRDITKREGMGEVACSLSDFCFVTTDNPRKEDPKEISDQIVKGFYKKNYEVELSRYLAIKKAILMAKKGDIVLIAGKGHERTQIFYNSTNFFDDREVVKEILKKFRS
jgi:UDP-N-acetylmuramoyl-L-alanyl-D-glutamate--2,6-diaminopimelate ligase